MTDLHQKLESLQSDHGEQVTILVGNRRNYGWMVAGAGLTVTLVTIVANLAFGLASNFATRDYVDKEVGKVTDRFKNDGPWLRDKENILFRIQLNESRFKEILLEIKDLRESLNGKKDQLAKK